MTPEYEAKIRAEERRRALEEAAQHFERWHAEESVVQNGNSDGDIWEETVSGIILGGPAIARELRKLASAPAPLHIPEKQEWAALIAAERRRQVEEEGWTPEHDDEHTDESLAAAASCYAWPDRSYPAEPPSRWQWEPQWWKPGPTRIRELVKAGALIAAEIDRLQRASVQLFPSPPEQDASHVEAVASRGETAAPGDPAPLTDPADCVCGHPSYHHGPRGCVGACYCSGLRFVAVSPASAPSERAPTEQEVFLRAMEKLCCPECSIQWGSEDFANERCGECDPQREAVARARKAFRPAAAPPSERGEPPAASHALPEEVERR